MSGKRKDNKNTVLKTGESQRKDNSYSYRWTDQFGKRHDVYAKTLKELREKEKDLEKTFLNGVDYSKRNITFGELYEEWIELKSVSPSTKSIYQHCYKRSIEPYFKNYKISEINKNVLIRFFKTHIETVSANKRSFIVVYTIINQIMGNAADNSIIEKNPCILARKQILPLLKENKGKEALTKTEEEIFFNHMAAQKNRLGPMLKLILNTGIRAGEASALRWADIDMEKRLIHIQHTIAYNGEYYLSKPKTKASDRIIPMNDVVYEILSELKSKGKKNKEKLYGYDDYVFMTKHGNLYSAAAIDSNIDYIIKTHNETSASKLPHFTVHTLRHTFATRMIENNVNPKTVQAFLGHSSITITMDVYTSITTDKMLSDISSVEI